jgi:glycosyltransferase involved in cell wall biosynthesis
VSPARAVLTWHDIGHYHHRRNEVAHRLSTFELEVFEISGKPEYAEFASGVPSQRPYSVTQLGLDQLSDSAERANRIHEALHACEPNVVFVPGWSHPASLMAIEWCAENEVACVLMSDSTDYDRARVWWKEAIKRRIVALTQAGFVAGRRAVDYLAQLGMPEERIANGYDVVDNSHFWNGARTAREAARDERERCRLPQHYFLCCSRFIEVKNLSRLIDAYRLYHRGAARRGKEPWHLVLVGDGQQRGVVQEQIIDLDLTKFVMLTGYRSYRELPAYYGLADAFVLASVSEPWGLVVNEAMAAGLPVLVSERCGCAPDLVAQGRNGFTFDPYDVERLAALMTLIASEECNRAAMASMSRDIIAQWDLSRFVSGLDTAARVALDAPRKRPSSIDRVLLRRLAAR